MEKTRLDVFLGQLKALAIAEDPADQVHGLLQQLLSDNLAVAKEIFKPLDDDVTLYEDETLCVLHYRMPPGVVVPPHDHRIPAVIGVYEGVEENHFFEVINGRLVRQAIKQVTTGNVLSIPPESIHSVQTANDQSSAAIHVYLGELTKTQRFRYDWKTGQAIPLGDFDDIREEPLGDKQ